MNEERAAAAWHDASLAAALFALDPVGTGGVVLRTRPGPVRDAWLDELRAALPDGTPWRRMPIHTSDERLLGGLDLAATLSAGRPVAARGLLAEADGGVVLIPMAERMRPGQAARLASVLDLGELVLERDGLAERSSARVGLVVLDEGIDDERPPAALLDRLAFHIDLDALTTGSSLAFLGGSGFDVDDPDRMRAALPRVRVAPEAVETLCATAAAFGIDSVRAPLLALRAARAAAVLSGQPEVGEAELQLGARLVLAPRARALPAEPPPAPEPEDGEEAPASSAQPDERPDESPESSGGDSSLEDRVLEATASAIPPGLLDRLKGGPALQPRTSASGQSGLERLGLRGRRAGTRPGMPGGGVRLDVVETLRAAAPWQRLRQRHDDEEQRRLEVRRDDLRVARYKERGETTAIFAVDASGSTAVQRLAEAKGAVETLLSDCYVRRDRVAMIAFRGERSEIVLPPTRSLVRAKRCLGSLAGGGATPLAAGIETASHLARASAREGTTPLVVLLTDGSANLSRDGSRGREGAQQDALRAARELRAAKVRTLLVDTSPRPQAVAERLANEMDAEYVPLPRADASVLDAAVREARGRCRAGAGEAR